MPAYLGGVGFGDDAVFGIYLALNVGAAASFGSAGWLVERYEVALVHAGSLAVRAVTLPAVVVVSGLLATLLVVTFFVTSSDSGSLVIDHLTSGGKHDVPKVQRIFWAVTEGAVAAVLLIGGGLSALQTAAITTGLPFGVILVLMCYTVYLGLKNEYENLKSQAFA